MPTVPVNNQPPPAQPQATEPQLVAGEQVLWRRDLTKGVFRKHIIETQFEASLNKHCSH